MLTTRHKPTSQIAKWGPSKNLVARTALKNLLSSNHDVIDVSLDQCYSAHAAVSRAYFQVTTCTINMKQFLFAINHRSAASQ